MLGPVTKTIIRTPPGWVLPARQMLSLRRLQAGLPGGGVVRTKQLLNLEV